MATTTTDLSCCSCVLCHKQTPSQCQFEQSAGQYRENTIVSHQEEPKRILCFQCSSQTSMHPSIHSAWERFKFDWHKADYAWNTTIHHDASLAAHFVAALSSRMEKPHTHTHTRIAHGSKAIRNYWQTVLFEWSGHRGIEQRESGTKDLCVSWPCQLVSIHHSAPWSSIGPRTTIHD